MEEARAVLSRLERIEELERRGAAGTLLRELRALAREAEAWARRERDPRAGIAATALADAIGSASHHPHEALVRCALPAAPIE